MEPPQGFWATLWNFICFLPYFIGLLILGTFKGVILCPIICLIITIGNSAVILGLWPAHSFWTFYSIARAKILGPVLKLVLCVCLIAFLVVWPIVGIIASIVGGAGYGLLAPVVSTFDAVKEGRSDQFYHCICDGTWSTVKGSFTIVRDFTDVCFHSYFSIMDDLRMLVPPSGEQYEIRLLYLPGAVLVGLLGIMVDFLMITCVAICKSPYMLFKGWHRLFHDLIGREGPFLETICVPFAGLAILLWPAIVVCAVLASIISSIFLGAYAGVIAYQESSMLFGFSYIITSMAIYDEYSNDVLDMPEISCFPRLQYRKKSPPVRVTSFSRPNSFNRPPSRSVSLSNSYIELKPLELLQSLFSESKRLGESLISEGLIQRQDIEDFNSSKAESTVINIGLPTYCILQMLLRSIKSNSEGLLLRDNATEITSANRPKDMVFDWFINPLLIIKDQIKAHNLSEEEENYLCQLVLLYGNSDRVKKANLESSSSSETELKRAELDGFARRLRGITRSISRYPTFRRRFDALVQSLSEDLAKKNGGSQTSNGGQSLSRGKSKFVRLISGKSFNKRASNQDPGEEGTVPVLKDVGVV